jgi:di/tricarboxylate transporter
MLLGTVLSNTACAVLMAPIGLFLARETGANPHAILMAIALAASCSFLTPLGTPPNMIVWEPGGYRFVDYMKVGVGLSVVCALVGILIIPWRWPVFPG